MGIFTKIGNSFESAIGSFVSGTASNVIDLIAPWVLISVTIYFLITGYMVMAGRISEPLSDVLIKGSKIALISMAALSAGGFMSYVAGSITGLEKDLLRAVGGKDATSIYALLDNSYEKGLDATAQAFKKATDLNFLSAAGEIIMLIIIGLIGTIGLVVMTSIAAAIILLSKMAVVVALGLGPLFICCLMFPATAGWFDSWLKTCLTYVLTSVIVASFLVIFVNVYLTEVEQLTNLFTTGGDSEGVHSGALARAITILLITLISSFVMLQSSNIAASLAGGVALASMSLTGMLKQASSATVGSVGAKSAGKMTYGAANFASRGALERGASGLSQNVANRYAQHMRRDGGSNSINS